MPATESFEFIITALKFPTMNGCCPGRFAIHGWWPERQVKSIGDVRQIQPEFRSQRASGTSVGTPGLAHPTRGATKFLRSFHTVCGKVCEDRLTASHKFLSSQHFQQIALASNMA